MRRILKYLGIFILVLLLLLSAAILFVRSERGQNILLPKITEILSEQLGTKVEIDHINAKFFTSLVLEDVIIYDQKNEKLLTLDEIDASIGLFSLTNRTISLNSINLSNTSIFIYSDDSIPNYQFILDNFANAPTTSLPKNSQPWKFDIDDINLENTSLKYYVNKDTITADLDRVELSIDRFDLDVMNFELDEVNLENSNIYYSSVSSSEITPASAFPEFPFQLSINETKIKNTLIHLKSDAQNTQVKIIDPSNLKLKMDDVVINNLEINESIKAKLSSFDVKEVNSNTQISELQASILFSDYTITLEDLIAKTPNSALFGKVSLSYDSFLEFQEKPENTSIYFNATKESYLSPIDLKKFKPYLPDSLINLDQLKNNISIEGSGTIQGENFNFEQVTFKIPNTINFNGSLKTDGYSINANLNTTTLTYQNVMALFPMAKEFDILTSPRKITLKGNLSGNTDLLKLKNFSIDSGEEMHMKASGTIQNVTSDSLYYKLTFNPIEIQPDKFFNSKVEIPEQIQRLGTIDYVGDFSGNFEDFTINGDLNTSRGNANLDVTLNTENDFSTGSYSGTVKLSNADLGYILQDSTLGITSLDLKIDGRGFDQESLNASVSGTITEFNYQGKKYENTEISGKLNKSIFEGSLSIKDDDLSIDFLGVVDLNDENPSFVVDSKISTIDLEALGFSNLITDIHGDITGNLKGRDINSLQGDVLITNFGFSTIHGNYEADSSITFKVKHNKEEKILTLDSPFADGRMTTNMDINLVPKIIAKYITEYIPFTEDTAYTLLDSTVLNPNDSLHLTFDTKDISPILTTLTKDKLLLKEGIIRADYLNKDDELSIKATLDSLYYNGYVLTKTAVFIDGKQDFINVNLLATGIGSSSGELIPNLELNAELNNRIADINLEIYDNNFNQRLLVGGNLTRNREFVFKFHEDLIINERDWKFSPYNGVYYGEDGLFLQDLSISKDRQAITMYTDENKNGPAFEILFDEFLVSEINKIIGRDDQIVSGIINGFFTVNNYTENPFFTSDLKVDSIFVTDQYVGIMDIALSQDTKTNSVKGELNLIGPGNEVTIEGSYNISSQNLEGNINLKDAQMYILDPFVTEIVKDSEGQITGNIKAGGSINDIKLDGSITLKNAETTAVLTNSRYKAVDETINVTSNTFDLGEIQLEDMDGEIAYITGKIYHQNFQDIRLDMDVSANDFNFLNTPPDYVSLYYGKVDLNTNISLKGPLTEVEIRGNAATIPGSKLALSPLASETQILEDDFIVFNDPLAENKDSSFSAAYEIENALPLDLDMNISVDEESTFEFIINPITGDRLECKGTADLNLKVKPSGDIEMYGRYIVNSGKYKFTYGLISKEFNIEPGSTVSFNGDPLEGVLDVRAAYTTSTSVYNLIAQETDLNAAQISEAQRKTRLIVGIDLEGNLLNPEIKPTIELPEGYESSISDVLENKIDDLKDDPNEMNNQVFGLILFNSFVLTENASTDIAQTGSGIAFSSLSSLISSQLNRLAQNLIGGFQIQFDVDTYRAGLGEDLQDGQVTEFGLDVSKQLLDDRLTISAGTNINLSSTADQSTFNSLAGDFLIEYKLTRNGNYRIKVFSKSNFDRILDENRNKNGVSFYIRREFGEVKRDSVKIVRKEE